MGCTDEIALVRLQQGFVTSEMGFNSEVTRQQTKSRSCPLWVISGHSAQESPCLLYPQSGKGRDRHQSQANSLFLKEISLFFPDIATGTRELWVRFVCPNKTRPGQRAVRPGSGFGPNR